MRQAFLLFVVSLAATTAAQPDSVPIEADSLFVYEAEVEADDESSLINAYDGLNATLGGDSVRRCEGFPCSGWVEDHYPDGRLKHRGYYQEGHLLVFKNFHPNGQVERDMRVKDNTHSTLHLFRADGTPRSETEFLEDRAVSYTEHYANGQVRYHEERHRSEPYYLVMDLFAPNGDPISTLHLVDKKRVVFEQKEFWPGSVLRVSGLAQFDPSRYDTRRIGSWVYYDRSGTPEREERYVEGKVHETAALK